MAVTNSPTFSKGTKQFLGSYASETHGPIGLGRELINLIRLHLKGSAERVQTRIQNAMQVEQRIQDSYGVRIDNLDMLEVGPGQLLIQAVYFAQRNRVTAIDRDLIIQGCNPAKFLRMFQVNGARRFAKTVGRKILGVDRHGLSELRRQLGLSKLPKVNLLTMDVCQMSFPANSFDFVYSRSVLHQLRDPEIAAREISRVLKPGGIAYVTIHPYSSYTGCLDPRMFTSRRSEVADWAHLSPHLRETVYEANLQLNRMRIHDWKRLLSESMPEAKYNSIPAADRTLFEKATDLHRRGELLDYSTEELLTGELAIIWRKYSPSRLTAEHLE